MNLYHIINRGVDGRDIFLDSQDYARFAHDLFEFNDTAPATPFHRATNVGRTTSYIREKIIDIHGWVLMRNHYHLLISEKREGGLTYFLRKLSGYARYFNDRHKRKGALLQGRTKKVLINRHEHFLYILHYIHLNPLDYFHGAEDWRERDKGNIPGFKKAHSYLRTYRWSSYLDYCGERNFPSLLTKKLFEDSLGNYENALEDYLAEPVDPSSDLGSLE